jgi:cytochrome c peroxidase
MPIASENLVTLEGVELGRMLFYDPVLSEDSTFSCASCHQQKYAFTDGPKQFSEGVNGALMNRNTMPLFNLAWNNSFFWDGRSGSIESQVFQPVNAHDEMNLDWNTAVQRIQRSRFYPRYFNAAFGPEFIDSVLVSKAIAQFERTLISSNSKFDQVLRGEAFFTEEEYLGYGLVNDQTKGNCLLCHTTDGNGLGTTGKFSNNGLDYTESAKDYSDKGRGGVTGVDHEVGLFRIPSIRNVAFTGPYMHDGRFETLEEVLDFYSEGLHSSYNIDSKIGFINADAPRLTDEEKEQIMAFLLTMTDSVFVENTAFGNPFVDFLD